MAAAVLEIPFDDIQRAVGGLLWPFIRMGGFVLAAPIFGTRTVPARVRVLFALGLAWLLMPVIPAVPATDPLSPEGLLIAIQQVLLGVAMGFAFQLVFAAVTMAGQNAAASMGLGFAAAVDPQNGVQVPVVGQFYSIVATLMFLAVNGHLVMLSIIADSFRVLPVGGDWPQQLPSRLVAWGSHLFAAALLLSMPVMAALLLVNLAFGVIVRAAPQLNIFAVGFPLTLLAGLIVILLTLSGFATQLGELFTAGFDLMRALPE